VFSYFVVSIVRGAGLKRYGAQFQWSPFHTNAKHIETNYTLKHLDEHSIDISSFHCTSAVPSITSTPSVVTCVSTNVSPADHASAYPSNHSTFSTHSIPSSCLSTVDPIGVDSSFVSTFTDGIPMLERIPILPPL
jgi:hypothetical protein